MYSKGQTHRKVGTQSYGSQCLGPPDCRKELLGSFFFYQEGALSKK